jgi:hypothetical protein
MQQAGPHTIPDLTFSLNHRNSGASFLLNEILIASESMDSSVGIATGHELDGRGSISSKGKIYSVLHSVQIGSEVHPASYTIGRGGSVFGDKVART